MLDTLTLADRLTEAGVDQKQANAIAHAIHDAQGETVTKGDIQHLATKGDLANTEVRLTWRIIGAVAVIGAILRFVG